MSKDEKEIIFRGFKQKELIENLEMFDPRAWHAWESVCSTHSSWSPSKAGNEEGPFGELSPVFQAKDILWHHLPLWTTN